MDLPLSELLIFAALLLAAGAVAGITAGLLGVGGGIVIVPVLYHVFTLLGMSVNSFWSLCVVRFCIGLGGASFVVTQ